MRILPFVARVGGTPEAQVSIRPECDYIFLNGSENDASSQFLRGKVVLILRRGVDALGVRLKMSQRYCYGHLKTPLEGPERWETGKHVLHQQELELSQACSVRHSALKDTYEFAFEILIPGTQQESFRGCRRCSIAYGLEGSMLGGSALGSFVPIRIIRCPAMSSYELMDPVSSYGKWAGKIEFSVTSPHQANALGGTIPIEVQVATLESGIEVTQAKVYLCEYHEVRGQDVVGLSDFAAQKRVAEWTLVVGGRDQAYQEWQQSLPLPCIAKRCSPDLSASGITISHTLHFSATFVIDGFESEFETSMPLYLFTSPELPINGWDTFARYGNNISKETRDELGKGIQAPPQYCADCCPCDPVELHVLPPPAYADPCLSKLSWPCHGE